MRTVDSFGQLRLDGGEVIRARVIEVNRRTLAAFPEADPTVPMLLVGVADYWTKGRGLYMDLLGDGEPQLEFRRASCGCQTPMSLRGPRSQFLDRVPAPAET